MTPAELTEARKRLGLTQADLGAITGYSRTQITRIEAGRLEGWRRLWRSPCAPCCCTAPTPRSGLTRHPGKPEPAGGKVTPAPRTAWPDTPVTASSFVVREHGAG